MNKGTPHTLTHTHTHTRARAIFSGGAEVVGALRTTLLLGAPMVNKFQDPDTKALTMSFLRISPP